MPSRVTAGQMLLLLPCCPICFAQAHHTYEQEFVYLDAHILCTPAIADIDADQHDELVVAVSYFYDKEYYDDPAHQHELKGIDKEKYVAGDKGGGGGGAASCLLCCCARIDVRLFESLVCCFCGIFCVLIFLLHLCAGFASFMCCFWFIYVLCGVNQVLFFWHLLSAVFCIICVLFFIHECAVLCHFCAVLHYLMCFCCHLCAFLTPFFPSDKAQVYQTSTNTSTLKHRRNVNQAISSQLPVGKQAVFNQIATLSCCRVFRVDVSWHLASSAVWPALHLCNVSTAAHAPVHAAFL